MAGILPDPEPPEDEPEPAERPLQPWLLGLPSKRSGPSREPLVGSLFEAIRAVYGSAETAYAILAKALHPDDPDGAGVETIKKRITR
jgi:hypothetical protein